MKKQMKTYPAQVDIVDLERIYRRLLADTTVVFVQVKTCADVIEPDGWEATGWISWSHLKGGSAKPTGDILNDTLSSFDGEACITWWFTIEWMRADHVLHAIEIR